jgi:hypothetical protein
MNGRVILWDLKQDEETSEYGLFFFQEYQLNPDKSASIKDPKYHVQSLQFRINYIIVGTRNGDIYFLLLPTEEKEDGKLTDMKSLVKLV